MLTKEHYSRYSRQLLVAEMDDAKQIVLLQSSVVIVGLGGLGCIAAAYLAGAGIGHIRLVDDDRVELSNLPRQPLYAEQDIGTAKAEVACQRLRERHPDIRVDSCITRLSDDNAFELIKDACVVLDCTDNMSARQSINQACYQANKPLVSGAASGSQGQLLLLHPEYSHGCYRCLYDPVNSQPNNCFAQGILGPVVGLIGMMQALQTLLFLTLMHPLPWGTLRLFDGLSGEWQSLQLPAVQNCPVCGEHHANYR